MTVVAYRDEKDYEAQLRKIVLYSADVLPKRVSDYIKKVGRRGSWDAIDQVLKEYSPLVNHLTKDYVDYVLNRLIVKPTRGADGSPVMEYEDIKRYGIQDSLKYFPPSPVQGPFLPLLQKDEDEGLRLIHTLANAAVAGWRLREQNTSYGRRGPTPLPVVINLRSGPREFWGSSQVYYWFRPTNNGPDSVSSGLMALEWWMEKQIEAGREAEELFDKVLRDSDCIAVVGVCVGIALAYHQKCLQAALPLASAPLVWLMDIARLATDSGGSFAWDPFERDKVIYMIQAERDKRPQRKLDIRNLAPLYLFTGGADLREQFERAVARFTEELPFFYEEEKENEASVMRRRQEMDLFQTFGDPQRYKATQLDDGRVLLQPEHPDHIKARNEAELAGTNARMHWISVNLWAAKTLEQRQIADGMTLETAVAAAKEFQQQGDFTEPLDESWGSDKTRLLAIAGVAAAALVTDFTWVKQQDGLLGWCREVLLAAARTPQGSGFYAGRDMKLPWNPKVSAALGLGALIVNGSADTEVRKQILELVGEGRLQVVEGVFKGLYGAWEVEPALCWNALSLALHLSMRRRPLERDWSDPDWTAPDEEEIGRQKRDFVSHLISEHLKNVEQGDVPELPKILRDDEVDFLWDTAAHAIKELPLSQLCTDPTGKARLLQLNDGLMAWTIAKNTPDQEEPYHSYGHTPYEWNNFFFGWATVLSQSLNFQEVQHHLLDPARACWSQIPRLTADLQGGYVRNRLALLAPLSEDTLAGWREICNWVLDSEEVISPVGRRRAREGVGEALSLIVFVRHGGVLLTDKWKHAPLFSDVISKWVGVVGQRPRQFSYLLTMLTQFWSIFPFRLVIEWLSQCVNATSDIGELWKEHGNGEQTAALLQQLWHREQNNIRSDAASLERYSALVDQLVTVGVPLASVLQQRLEQRT